MLGTYVKLELANPLTKHTLLVIGQIQDVFNTLRNKVLRISVKTSEEILDFKTQQLVSIEV